MSDSFADLWNSTAPSKPQNLPLSQQKRAHVQQKSSQQDVFALLSQSSSSSSRYGGAQRVQNASAISSSSPGSRSITPNVSNHGVGRPTSSMAQASSTKSGGDAFGDLFGGGSIQSNGAMKNMTMAERAALAQKQKQASHAPAATTYTSTSTSAWAGLDSLGAGSFATSSSTKSVTPVVEDDWGLGDFGATSKAPSPPQTTAAPARPPPPAVPSKSGSLWDLDDFDVPSKPQDQVDSPDFGFDFGNREDRDVSSKTQNDAEDDILGMLSQPVEAVRAQSRPPPQTNRPSSSSSTSRPSRSHSPPPHILGQIVEMGFSVAQAKAALARTETGTDVQAALDSLLGEANENGHEDSYSPPHRPSPPRRGYSDDAPPALPRNRTGEPQRDASSRTGTPNVTSGVTADAIIAQASEIGLNVFAKASMFWNQGKERVQKVYEEASSNTTPAPRDTRPKWMQDATESGPPVRERQRPNLEGGSSGFRDHGDHVESSAFADDSPVADTSFRPQTQRTHPKAREPEPDLFAPAASEPKAYVSPWRRKKADAPAAAVAAPAAPIPSRRATPPAPKPKRSLPFCAASTVTRVTQHKIKGTEAFKLGQFSVAVDEYTKAINLLPAGHLLLIPLQTNRAIARIKCGESKGAVEDASGALSIIGSKGESAWENWNPHDEEGGWELENGTPESDVRGGHKLVRAKGAEWSDAWGRGVDLKDGWVKAVKRRAEAYEALEKWKEARKDWEILAGGGGGCWVDSTIRQEAVRGLGRCKKMVDADSAANGTAPPRAPVAPKVKPRPRPTPVSSTNNTPGVAVEAYRAQVNAAEAEDALKHSLKDAVDEKLLAWKKGKETNLRALLASLDLVLWDEVLKEMGKKPGMADLVSGGGVKKWYMKAVSRVHPDKLNANNSTVEQRMIAGGVFGALNEAWLAFKQ